MEFRYITPFVNEDFFTVVKRGMRDAAAAFGVEASFTGTQDADCAALEHLIARAVSDGCAGIAVSVPDARLNGAIKRAKDAGVPAVAFNIGGTKKTPVLSNVCQDVYAAGLIVGRLAGRRIAPGTKILVTLHDDVEVLHERKRGILDGLCDAQATIIISGNEPQLAARSIREALLQEREIGAVIGTGQSDTQGAGIVAAETGIYTAGFDVCEEILRMICDGLIDFTIDQQPYIQGFYPLTQLYHYVQYGLAPADIDTGRAVIDRKNVENVLAGTKKGYR